MTRVGTAGWAIPAAVRERFAGSETRLQRYARVFPCTEINSTFYRAHRPSTYARWAASVPGDFRFALKLPREITHRRRLADAEEPLAAFLDQSAALGEKRDVLLVQLPPSLAFEPHVASRFFALLRAAYPGRIACEPRHPSWFGDDAGALLREVRAARVAADPAPDPRAARPGGWEGFAYFRWHGAPRMYWSAYAPERLDDLAAQAALQRGAAWCIFDNTAAGAAAADALALVERLAR